MGETFATLYGRPGFVYNFNTRSLLTFEENLKYKCDVPLIAYIDFETTAPTDDCLDPESIKMFAVSHVIIFASHPELNLDCIIIEHSFGHLQVQLCSLNYLTNEQLKFKDLTTLKQLRDCALSFASKKKKIASSKMFTTELKFGGDCLMKWFNAKLKSQNVVLSNKAKRKYEIENPIDWQNGRCCLCTYLIEINPTLFEAKGDQMSYSDFVTNKENKFLRNICFEEELSTTKTLKDFSTYHKNFARFLHVAVYLPNAINTMVDFNDCLHQEFVRFCNEFCTDSLDFKDIKRWIAVVEIKNSPQSKISKSTLQLYAYVYQKIMDFPNVKFHYETLTTKDLFIYVLKILNVKIHLHHSHVTGKILGYTYDFCNEKVRENKDVFSCVAYNFFGFDIYFLIKGVRLSAWYTKDINLEGSGLTNINLGTIAEMKLIDTMKYFLISLGKLASTLGSTEKERVEKLTVQFLTSHDYLSKVWGELTENQIKILLEIIVSGKGVIPYEKINSIVSLDNTPKDGIFFSKDKFFSNLKGKAVDDEAYENSKRLYILLRMRNLSNLNDLYNAQDVILLLEIIENQFQALQEKTGYNPRIINLASKLSGCIQREKSKVILALPTNNTQMEVFEKTVAGGFNCVNTRLSFYTELLMPNLTEKNYNAMTVDKSFKAYKRDDLKVIYNLRVDGEKKPQKRGLISKILKLDENNQYGFTMTKPMPTGCIKEYPSPSFREFNLLLYSVTLNDPFGHLFVVEFNKNEATEREMLYNEIFPPIIEKQKTLDADERSIYQLLKMLDTTQYGKPRTYRCTPKSHATMFPKKFTPLYLEDLKFLILRAGWHVTKLYSHFKFEQDSFKKNFVLMNQKSRQDAKNNIEKDFYKLMNNANFGFDCSNNANNTKLESIIDEMNEISYIKKYYNLFDHKVEKFVSSNILEKNIIDEYNQAVSEVRLDDPFKNAHLREIENTRNTNLDGLKCLEEKEKKSKKRKMKEIETRVEDALKNKKIKTMIDFDKSECNRIKSILVKRSDTVNVSSRFIRGKMLMFAKLSLKSFFYDMIDVFCFPDEKIREVYNSYQIKKCFLYQNLTDTSSTLLFFNFFCKLDCSAPEYEARKIIFECTKNSKIAQKLDFPNVFWEQFDMPKLKTRKQMGLYEVENINNSNICIIDINPKEYFEKFKDRNINKKHKGDRRDAPGMCFESYGDRIVPLRSIDCKKEEKKKIIQKRLQVKNTNMVMNSVNKVQFASLNDKRYYFSDGIVSLPYGRPLLKEVRT